MSASEQMAQMLNELMGPRRNAVAGENIEIRFDDEEVCKFFLVGYCPNEMFVNTKTDLGPCGKMHDEGMRKAYRDSDRFEKLGYEEAFLSFIRKLHNDMQKKIKRNMDRLAITQPNVAPPTEESKAKMEKEVEELTEKINECMAQAESLGAAGKIEEAQQVVEQADNHKAARDQLKRALVGAPAPVTDDGMAKQMEVCKICGCFLIVNDAQQRIDEHFLGKQHVGFAKIKATMEEFERRIAEKEAQKHSTRDEPRKNKDKERRRSRSKERPSTHSSSSSHRTSRDRSETHREPSTRRRSRSREGRDRRHQDRPHSDRDRDRDRHHRHERDEPSRRDNDRKRHSPSKDRSKDRSRDRSKERHSRRNGDTR